MDLKEFLPEEKSENDIQNSKVEKIEKISQNQFYDLIVNKDSSWQSIIYELIQTEQLDPWDIDLVVLTNKYLEKIRELEEANFFVSSKVLLAASYLLRIKSEILLNQYLRSLDDILFGKKEQPKREFEKIEIDESEIPDLFPRTPLPRTRQVTLQELMSALGKAINTENRRIKKEITKRQAERLSHVDIPKTRINVRDRIRKIYAKIQTYLSKKPKTKVGFTDIIGKNKEERIAAFLPILHLENQQKVWLEQENHLDEIWIWLYKIYKKQHALEQIGQEIEEVEKELNRDETGKMRKIEKINKEFENPLADFFDNIS